MSCKIKHVWSCIGCLFVNILCCIFYLCSYQIYIAGFVDMVILHLFEFYILYSYNDVHTLLCGMWCSVHRSCIVVLICVVKLMSMLIWTNWNFALKWLQLLMQPEIIIKKGFPISDFEVQSNFEIYILGHKKLIDWFSGNDFQKSDEGAGFLFYFFFKLFRIFQTQAHVHVSCLFSNKTAI